MLSSFLIFLIANDNITDCHTVTCTPNRIRWVSFPIIKREVEIKLATKQVLSTVEDQTNYFTIRNNKQNDKEWMSSEWKGGLDILNSKIGYKIQCNHDVSIPLSGQKLSNDTRIELRANDSNWIGYFIEKPMLVHDAFAEIWDHVLAVYSEDWAYIKDDIFPEERCVLIYGKMYDIKVDVNCSFSYGTPITPIVPKERESTLAFYYQEHPSYTPINIIDLGDPDVEKIAVFQGDVCIGASKVEELPVQILTFGKFRDCDDNIYFKFYYGDRLYLKPQKFYIYQKHINSFVEKDIELKPYKFINISFNKYEVIIPQLKVLSNYPNPFNPITQISYSLPVDGDIELTIYNIKGQKVKTLIKGKTEAGHYNITWDSTDNSGRKVSSGVYFYQLKTTQKTLHKKMLLMK